MKQLFNDNWFFHREPLETPIETFFETDDWQLVDLPHDWMIYDSTDLYAQGVSCYRKTFTVEEKKYSTGPMDTPSLRSI